MKDVVVLVALLKGNVNLIKRPPFFEVRDLIKKNVTGIGIS